MENILSHTVNWICLEYRVICQNIDKISEKPLKLGVKTKLMNCKAYEVI